MSDFEDRLRAALRPLDPPEGFAERVIARAHTQPRKRPWLWTPRLAWVAGFVAAGLVVGPVSVSMYQRAQGEKAARQAEWALRIAAEKLNVARNDVLKNSALGSQEPE